MLYEKLKIKRSYQPFLLLILLGTIIFSSCKLHRSINLSDPPVCILNTYQNQDNSGTKEISKWWEEFNSQNLNNVVESALEGNLDLKKSWWQVAELCAEVKKQGSYRYPEILSTTSVRHLRNSGGGFSTSESQNLANATLGTSSSGDSITNYLLLNSLSYEVDLWQRVNSKFNAAYFNMQASREDLESVALMLTGTVADIWFTIIEQNRLLKVINHQIDVSQTQLELVELRYSLGDSSALDVYQQRLQLSQTRAEKPPIQSLLDTAQNKLQTLMGKSPEKSLNFDVLEEIKLPSLPLIGTPVALLYNRPDLRAQYNLLKALDEEVAAAVADCFPRLDISISYDFQGTKFKNILDEQISRIIGNLLIPIIDGGRRQAEVAKRKAILCQELNNYGQKFLNALLEVEDAIVIEKWQLNLIELLSDEIKIANINLEESRWHYINGLNDYLTVIAAIQTLQALERRMVTENIKLLINRSKLYLALGGSYLEF